MTVVIKGFLAIYSQSLFVLLQLFSLVPVKNELF